MNVEETARAQAEAALKEKTRKWAVASVSTDHGKVILRRDHSSEEPLVQEARELLAQHEGTVRRMEDMGWTIGKARFGCANFKQPGPLLVIEARAEVEGHKVKYSLHLGGSEWSHFLEGDRIDYWASRYAPAPHVMSPRVALRVLEQHLATHRSYHEWELYQEFLAEHGPDEEPDPAEFERVRERFRRGELLEEQGYADYGNDVDDPVFTIPVYEERRDG